MIAGMFSCAMRVIVFRDKVIDGNPWIAASLQYDLGAEGNNPAEAMQNLRVVIGNRINADLQKAEYPLSRLHPGHVNVWRIYEENNTVVERNSLQSELAGWFVGFEWHICINDLTMLVNGKQVPVNS